MADEIDGAMQQAAQPDRHSKQGDGEFMQA